MRDLYMYLDRAINEVESCGIEVPNISHIVTMKASKTWGQCCKRDGHYIIRINEVLLREDVPEISLMNTLVHEVLHSCKGCLNHGKLWKSYASRLNYKYGYSIKRCSSSDEKDITDKVSYKYTVVCKKCGCNYNYSRRTDLVKQLEKKYEHTTYRCSCGCDRFKLRVL